VHGQLSAHPKSAPICGQGEFFCPGLIFECDCDLIRFPFGNAVL